MAFLHLSGATVPARMLSFHICAIAEIMKSYWSCQILLFRVNEAVANPNYS
jgi:hypothetical protein